MDVNIAQSFPHKLVFFSKLPSRIILCTAGQRQILQKNEDFSSPFEACTRQFILPDN